MRFKNFLLAIVALGCTFTAQSSFGQNDKAQRPSPAMTAAKEIGDLNVTIVYSAPAVKGRKLWGELVPFGKVWRTGANEATTFEVNKDVTVNGQKLAAGKYALFTIPGEKEWTFIFNKEANQWGAYNYKKEEDALRVTGKVGKAKEMMERMQFDISDKGVVTFGWENLTVDFTVKAAK